MERKFKINDIVKTTTHKRLMVVDEYYDLVQTVGNDKPGLKVVVTEGGMYREEDLTLVFREHSDIENKSSIYRSRAVLEKQYNKALNTDAAKSRRAG